MLLAATAGRLPPELIDHVQAAASFGALTREELIEIARRLSVARASDLDVSDELLGSIAEVALASGRLGHELKGLLSRLPSGEWTAKKAAPAPAPAAAAEAPAKKRGASTTL